MDEVVKTVVPSAILSPATKPVPLITKLNDLPCKPEGRRVGIDTLFTKLLVSSEFAERNPKFRFEKPSRFNRTCIFFPLAEVGKLKLKSGNAASSIVNTSAIPSIRITTLSPDANPLPVIFTDVPAVTEPAGRVTFVTSVIGLPNFTPAKLM